jgi:hypothetical protein
MSATLFGRPSATRRALHYSITVYKLPIKLDANSRGFCIDDI